ncbi:hypothetical protein ACN28E_40280 [Archangium lansingense]|uniref:hypothetical protein n=1 Tax=Archangium lansingense TaxID=2995310 RepID=UPI003B7D558D
MTFIDDGEGVRPPPRDLKRKLDEANQHAEEQAPTTDSKNRCMEEDFINDVTPAIQVRTTPGWYDSADITHSTPAQVVLSMRETRPALPYRGSGVVTVTAGNAALFSDPECTSPALQAYGRDELLAGAPLYVRGNAVGDVDLQLTLTPSGDAQIVVHGPATATVTVQEVNIVTPHVQLVESIGWLLADKGHAAPACIEAWYTESTGAPPYQGRAELLFDAQKLEFFEDEGCTTPANTKLPNGTTEGNKKRLFVRGKEVASHALRLKLDDSGTPRVRVLEGQDVALEVKQAKLVKPCLEAEYQALLVPHRLLPHEGTLKSAYPTPPSRLELTLEQDQPGITYGGGATLSFSSDVELFTDEAGDKPVQGFDGKKLVLDRDLLAGGKKVTLYLRAKGAGPLEATLAPEATSKLGALAQRSVFVAPNAVLKLVAVQLELELYEHSKPHSQVFRDTQAPAAAKLSDEQKVKRGGIVQVQDNGHHVRAKLVVKKPADELWTVGGDGCKVVLGQTARSGGLKLFKGDIEQVWPLSLGRADFSSGEVSLSIEGSAATNDFRHVCIDVGLDRAGGGLAHTPKRNGDFALVTVVAFEKLTPDTADYKQYINLPVSGSHPEHGRKLKSQAKLTKPLSDVEILFTLIPVNTNQANLPAAMKYQEPKDSDVAVKTDAQGIATSAELELSRFTSDKFTVAAYVKQAPPVKDSAPSASCSKPIEVWQEVFYKYATMTQDNGTAYTDKSATLEGGFATSKLKVTRLGAVATPLHKRFLKAADSQNWMNGVLGAPGDRQMNIALIDTILGNPKDTGFNWANLNFQPAQIDLPNVFDDSDLANKATWLRSAQCQVTWNGNAVNMRPYVTLVASGGGAHTLSWDLSALGPYTAPGTVAVAITLTPNNGPPLVHHYPGLNPASYSVPIPAGATFDLSSQAQWLAQATCSMLVGTAGNVDISTTTTLTVNNGVFRLAWSTPALAPFDGAGTVAVSFLLIEYPVLSGISWGATTIVGMRFRQGTLNQPDENTVLHEAGHYLGLAASTLPNETGTANGHYYFLNGPHCRANGNTCLMYDTVSPSVTFCDTCQDAIKGRDFRMPPVQGSAPF